MSNEPNIITDRELYELFKERLLEQEQDDAFTQKLIEMETITAFSTGPIIAPGIEKEKEMIRQLSKHGGFTTGFKWLFTGLSLATVIASLVFLMRPGTKAATVTKQAPAPPAAIQSPAAAPVPPQPAQILKKSQPGIPPVPPTEPPSPPQLLEYAPIATSDSGLVIPEPPLAPVAEEKKQSRYYSGPAPSGTFKPFMRQKHNEDSSHFAVDTTFNGVTRLEVTGVFCDVTLSPHSGKHLSVKGEMKVEYKGKVLHKPRYVIRYEQKDSVLKVWVENTQPKKGMIMIHGEVNYSGHLDFQVPERIALLIKNASGNITATGLKGRPCHLESNYGTIRAEDITTDLTLRSSSGNVAFEKVEGQVECKVSYGNINASNIRGKMQIHSSSGNIQLADLAGDLEIKSSYGNTDIKRLKGNLQVKTSSGHIKAEAVEGPISYVACSYGSITLTNMTSSLTVKASSGSVTLQGIRGNVSANSAYGKQHLNDIQGDVHITSSSGNIDLNNLNGALTINSTYGHVSAENCRGAIDIKTQSGNIKGKNIEVVTGLSLKATYGDISMNLKNKTDELSFNLQSTSGNIKLHKDGLKMESSDGKLKVEKGSILVKSSTNSGNQYFD
jgi:DUF4097 and DUF4098 domain-containing protein YvlB